jgi:hypothetical protein
MKFWKTRLSRQANFTAKRWSDAKNFLKSLLSHLDHVESVPEPFGGYFVSLGQQFQRLDAGAELLLECIEGFWEAEVVSGAAFDCVCIKFGSAKHGSDLVLSVLFALRHLCCHRAEEHEECESSSWALLCLLGGKSACKEVQEPLVADLS